MSWTILKVFFKLQKEMLEDVEDLIATHDKGAANGKGINMYERITLLELKNKINLLGDLLFKHESIVQKLFKGQINE